jgi:hypothetical protein
VSIKTFYKICIILCSLPILAAYQSETLVLKNSRLHVTQWKQDFKSVSNLESNKEQVILLSGPTDHRNSDSVWFARQAPKLAKSYRVRSIDRAGQIFGDSSAKLSYIAFGETYYKLY